MTPKTAPGRSDIPEDWLMVRTNLSAELLPSAAPPQPDSMKFAMTDTASPRLSRSSVLETRSQHMARHWESHRSLTPPLCGKQSESSASTGALGTVADSV